MTLSLLFFSSHTVKCQELQINKGLETGIYLGNLAWAGTNYFLIPQNLPKRNFQVPYLDAYHRNQTQVNIKNISDVSLWVGLVGAGLSGIQTTGKIDFSYQNILMQNIMITTNLTQTIKLLVSRERPSKWNTNDDYHSFFSGHSSVTATAAASSLYYAYFVPDAPKHAKWIGWTSAGISLLTGILRIESGKHYPSDVLIGWGVGLGVALLNIQMHQKN